MIIKDVRHKVGRFEMGKTISSNDVLATSIDKRKTNPFA